MERFEQRRGEIFERIFFRSAIAKALVGHDGRFLEVNDALCELFGYAREELIGAGFREITHPDDLDADERQAARLLTLETDSYRLEKRYLHRDGSVIWTDLSVASVVEDGEVAFFISQIQDITERKLAERALEREAAFRQALVELHARTLGGGLGGGFYEQLMRTAVAVIPGARAGSLLLRDDDDRFRFVAAIGFDLARLRETYLLERELYELYQGLQPQAGVVRRIENSGVPEVRRRILDEAGCVNELRSNVSIPITVGGRFVALLNLNSFEDDAFDADAVEMTTLLGQQFATLWQRLQLEADLRCQKEAFEHRALHDPLTGLPNRLLFDDRLEQALEQADRTGRGVALFFLDLDDFKSVNDRCGHHVGDALLCAVAERLRSSLRSSDTAARWGGDEFVVLLTNVMQPPDLDLVAGRLLDALTRPIDLDGGTFEPSVSLGTALYPQAADSAGALVRQADAALYEVKESGRGGACIRDRTPD